MARSVLSSTPSSFMKRLLGIHRIPPDLEVVPPMRSVFSRISGSNPIDFATSAAHIDPPPLPTITKSKVSSAVVSIVLSVRIYALGLLDRLRVVHRSDACLSVDRLPRKTPRSHY